MNLAGRDIRHNLGRFVLTCIGVGLLLGIVLSMIGIYRGLVDDALVLVRAPQAQIWVVEAGRRGPFAESSRLPEDTRDMIARLEGVTEAGAVTYQSVEARLGARKLRLNVIGHELGRPGGAPALVAGRPITRAHYELIADRRAGIALGTAIRLGRNVFTVVGLTDEQVDSGGNPVVHMTLADAQRLQFELEGDAARAQAARGTERTPPTINAVVARLAPGASAEAVAETIRRWKHLSALTQAEQEAMLLESVVEKARRQIGLFTGTLLLVSTVIIALIVYTLTDIDRFGPDPRRTFQANLAAVEARIAAACARAGRDRADVRLLPITKTVPAHILRLAYAAGIRAFGENKIQEATSKRESLMDLPIDWSIVGHLQTNKVKYLTRFASSFHALDSLRLAEVLNARLEREAHNLDVYVQVNTSNEATKYGLDPAALMPFLEELRRFSRLKPRGLMTLAVFSTDMSKVRPCFALLRRLRDQANAVEPTVTELSMGMSGDFEEAIAEGSNVVRVGQAIFGKRPTPDGHYWPGLAVRSEQA